MLIKSNYSNCSKVNFGRINQNKAEDMLPVMSFVAMSIDKEDEIKPSADNYRAYLNIQEVKDVSETELESNVRLAKEAVAYVQSMKLKSSTAMEHNNPLIMYMPSAAYKDVVSDISYLNNRRQRLTIDEYVEATKELVPALGVGNCSDQAILAASYLIEQKGLENVALVAVSMPGQNPLDPKAIDQHVFTVIGMDKHANIKEPETWGENAVVVDPWGDIAAPVFSKNPGASGITKLYSVFRTKYMDFDNYSKYIDPNHDKKTPYNWENYRKRLLS